MAGPQSTSHILQSLAINLVIAAMKAAAAAFTRSGAMLAEALHSFADCGNQALLLVGVRQARRPPDASHPLGYGRALYFWSFIVALLLFTAGGVFSIYEGVHKLRAPEPVERVWLGLAILAASLVLEGGATLSNVRALNARRKDVPFFRYLRETKESDLVVVFGENSAAVAGLACAIVALALAWATNDGRWDGAGSVMVGAVLVVVALFLAREVQSLLLGESADPEVERAAREEAAATPEVAQVLEIIAIQQGPGEVMLALKVELRADLDFARVCAVINALEARLRARRPELKWCFVEPDASPNPTTGAQPR